MEIVVPPPSVVLYIAIGMPCLVILLMLLAARGKPLLPRLLAAGVAFVVHTASDTYLFAPSPFQPFVDAMRAHTGKPEP